MTYNEVLQRIINGYHKVGYSCVGVLRAGIPFPLADEDTIFKVVLRKQLLNDTTQPPLYRVTATLGQHEYLLQRMRQGGNITDSLYVDTYDGKE